MSATGLRPRPAPEPRETPTAEVTGTPVPPLPSVDRHQHSGGGRDILVRRFTGPVPYLAGWAQQRAERDAVATGAPDRLLLLEHESVYTAGRRTEAHDRPVDGTPVVDVDRGGRITWHGPGQLVGYPIVALPEPVDVVAFVRALESALIAVCQQLGLPATRVDGRSGVWLLADQAGAGRPDRKVAAIGLRVSRGVTTHGFALNADCDLSWARTIVPCGIADAGVTSLSAELGRRVGVADVIGDVEREILAVLP